MMMRKSCKKVMQGLKRFVRRMLRKGKVEEVKEVNVEVIEELLLMNHGPLTLKKMINMIFREGRQVNPKWLAFLSRLLVGKVITRAKMVFDEWEAIGLEILFDEAPPMDDKTCQAVDELLDEASEEAEMDYCLAIIFNENTETKKPSEGDKDNMLNEMMICFDHIIERMNLGRDNRKTVGLENLYLDNMFGVDLVRLESLCFPARKEYLLRLSIMERSQYQRIRYDSSDTIEDRLRVIPRHMLPSMPAHYVPSMATIFAMGKQLKPKFDVSELVTGLSSIYFARDKDGRGLTM